MATDTRTDAGRLLVELRARGLTVRLQSPEDPALPLSLVVVPGSALAEVERQALRQYKEALLDLLWQEAHPSDGRAIGWPEPLTESQLRGVCVPWTEEDDRLVASQKARLR